MKDNGENKKEKIKARDIKSRSKAGILQENTELKNDTKSENQEETATENGERKKLFGFDMADFNTAEDEIAQIAKKEIVTIPVNRPKDQIFFRIHPTKEITIDLIQWEEDGNFYIVHKNALPYLASLTKKVKLYLGITREADHILFPVPGPDSKGRWNPWHESRDRVVQIAKKKWIRCQVKADVAGYDAHIAIDKYDEPEWTDKTMSEILEIAFTDRMIVDENHPVIKSIRGLK